MEEYAVIGKRLPRIDSRVKATGDAVYADDLTLPGMLHGKILRSDYAHARILSIDTSRAERLPGVRAVITGKDFPGIKVGFMKLYSDRLPLATDKVRYFGEGVAAVAAIDQDTAEEALDLIKVEYEELPVVLNAEEAMREGAPLIHDQAKNNIAASTKMNFGDVEQGFRDSDYIREDNYSTQRVTAGFIEPHIALASVDSSGRVLFQGSKQSPYITWRQLCRGLDMPLSKIRMVNPYVGGGFSGKQDAFDLDFCAIRLAQKTGQPVKIAVSQVEILANYRQRHAKNVWLKLGVKRDGTLAACDCKAIAEGGAYLGVGPLNIFLLGTYLMVPYRLPNMRYEGYRVYTNKPVCGAIRGQSLVVARYAFESLLSTIADELGIDQVEIRVKNACKSGETTPNGMRLDNVAMAECVEKAAQAINWKEKRSKKVPYRGIGFSCCIGPSGPRLGGHFGSSAVVKVVEDGTVTLIHGGTEIGQGCDTVMAQIAAEVLGVRLEDIQVAVEDTDTTTLDPGMFGDRCTFWTGNAVLAAAQDARAQLAETAAEILEARVEDLEFRGRKIYVRGNPEKQLPFLQVVRAAMYGKGQPIHGRGHWAALDIDLVDFSTGRGNIGHGWGAVAQALEVEVDPGTGRVRMLNNSVAEDVGQPINPLMLDGQLAGGGLQLMAQGLLEESLFDEKGHPLNPTFKDYKMPTAMDAPRCVFNHVLAPDPYGPFGAKGGGEAASMTALGAVANAVADAIGVRIKELPLTPEKILKAIKEREKGGK